MEGTANSLDKHLRQSSAMARRSPGGFDSGWGHRLASVSISVDLQTLRDNLDLLAIYHISDLAEWNRQRPYRFQSPV